MLIKEIMKSPVFTVDSNEEIHKVAQVLSTNNIGALIITHNGKPMGIVTERDILKKVVATGRDVRRVKASDIMSMPLKTADPNMDASSAASFMIRNGIKKLPVLEDGKLVGMVTVTDLMNVGLYVP